MRYKVLFFSLALGLAMVLALSATTETSLAAPAARPAPATTSSTSGGGTTVIVIVVNNVKVKIDKPHKNALTKQPGFVIMDAGSVKLSVDLGPGYVFSYKVKSKHIPKGKAWGWWKVNGDYITLGWTYIVKGVTFYVVPEGGLISQEEFEKFVLASQLTTATYAERFDTLKGGTFDLVVIAPNTWQVGYWSADSGYLTLGWTEVINGILIKYAMYENIVITEEAFLEYLYESIGEQIGLVPLPEGTEYSSLVHLKVNTETKTDVSTDGAEVEVETETEVEVEVGE